MKAVIVEVKGKFAVALSEEGSFLQIKNQNYTVGQQIEGQQFTIIHNNLIARISVIAICCMLICGLGSGAYAYLTPAYYVSMDINPSIEYTLNIFDRLLSLQAVNEDGSKLLQGMNPKSLNAKNIDEVMVLTLAEITRAGYFDDNTHRIVITTFGKNTNAAEKLAIHLKELTSTLCSENKYAISVEATAIEQMQMDEAKTMGVTPGKLLMVQTLLAEHPETKILSTEELLKKPFKDILAALEEEDAANAAKGTAAADNDVAKNNADDDDRAGDNHTDDEADDDDNSES